MVLFGLFPDYHLGVNPCSKSPEMFKLLEQVEAPTDKHPNKTPEWVGEYGWKRGLFSIFCGLKLAKVQVEAVDNYLLVTYTAPMFRWSFAIAPEHSYVMLQALAAVNASETADMTLIIKTNEYFVPFHLAVATANGVADAIRAREDWKERMKLFIGALREAQMKAFFDAIGRSAPEDVEQDTPPTVH